PGTGEGRARRGVVPGAARRRGKRRRAGGDARLLPAHLRRLRQHPGADPGLPAPPRAHHAAAAGAGAGQPRRSRHRRRAVPARWRHPVRTLLGQRAGRAPARPALRDLLLPGHRLLPARGPARVRTGGPGRAQAGARLPAQLRAQPAPCRRSGLRRGAGALVRGGGGGGAALCGGVARPLALPRVTENARMSAQLTVLSDDPDAGFPDPARALREPDGLLAVGGDLSPARLLDAYRHGIFPWFSEGQPILWWSPSTRMVFRPGAVRLSRRFRRDLRRCDWVVRADTAFDAVVEACAAPRPGQDGGTWIVTAMRDAYAALHRLGHAHSIEVLDGDALVGGLYGVAV